MKQKLLSCIVCLVAWVFLAGSLAAAKPQWTLATFSADITVPLGHRCMGVLPAKAKKIVDPLHAHGFVLRGQGQIFVLMALDYCEVRNGAYDQWREALAKAAGTRRERVLVCSLHQHDAPVTDTGAEKLLTTVGLGGELCDIEFQQATIRRVASALRDSLAHAQPVTHIGLGQAKVDKVASSRRVKLADGSIRFNRYSRSGGDPFHRDAPEGEIDPWLKTISFWNESSPRLALHCYAVHPMSYYGRGEISADFVGMARRRRQRDDASVIQIYTTGCSGDVTAGKYNDGSPERRKVLADRLYEGMKAAWKATKTYPLTSVQFRNTKLELKFHEGENFTRKALLETLQNEDAKIADRILAAMSLSSLERVTAGQEIDVPCLDLGKAQIVLLPGEAFVGYQLMAQNLRPDSHVMAIGYGECWTGYIPTRQAFEENFGHGWRWVAPGAESQIRAALGRVLRPSK